MSVKLDSYNEITYKLFIGNIDSPNNKLLLKNELISLIVDVSGNIHPQSDYVKTLVIPNFIDDINYTYEYISSAITIAQVAARAMNEELVNNGSVLVHCMSGINRSVFVTAVYLILYRGMSSYEAISLIRTKREGTLTNPALEYILHAYFETY